MTGDKKDREEKNLAEESPLIACLDALPPVFFTAGAFVVGKRLKSRIFTLGAVLAAAGGWMKVLWKLLLTGTKKDVPFLSRQMKYTMGTGFSLMAAGLIAKRKQLDGKKLLRAAGGISSEYIFPDRMRWHRAYVPSGGKDGSLKSPQQLDRAACQYDGAGSFSGRNPPDDKGRREGREIA